MESMRPIKVPGEVLSTEEVSVVDPDPTTEANLAFEAHLQAIKDAEHQAIVESANIIIY